MAQRVVFRRTDEPERFDFSEKSLRWVQDVPLRTFAMENVVRAAEDEFMAHVRTASFEYNRSYTDAHTYCQDKFPNLFRLAVMGKTRDPNAAQIVAEDVRG
jgi:hypothetical protein